MCCHFIVMTHQFHRVQEESLRPWNLKQQPNDRGQFDTWGWRIGPLSAMPWHMVAQALWWQLFEDVFILAYTALSRTWTEHSLKSHGARDTLKLDVNINSGRCLAIKTNFLLAPLFRKRVLKPKIQKIYPVWPHKEHWKTQGFILLFFFIVLLPCFCPFSKRAEGWKVFNSQFDYKHLIGCFLDTWKVVGEILHRRKKKTEF